MIGVKGAAQAGRLLLGLLLIGIWGLGSSRCAPAWARSGKGPAARQVERQAGDGGKTDTTADTTADTTERPLPVITAVRFEGNQAFSDEMLAQRVRTAPNRRLLGIPGLTWWRGLYRLGEVIGGSFGRALKRSGEPPAYLDRSTLRDDVDRLEAFYRQEGFREARATVHVEPSSSSEEVEVVFDVDPGAPIYGRWARYTGVKALSEAQRRRLARTSILRGEEEPVGGVGRGDTIRFRTEGRRYSETQLLKERGRILEFLHNRGYAAATRDSVQALVFPQPPDSFDVTFRIRSGRRYRVGAVHFRVTGPEEDAPVRTDTLGAGASEADTSAGRVTARIAGDSELSPQLLERSLRLRPGMWYDRSALLATKRRLEASGVFAFTDITALGAQPSDSTSQSPSDRSPTGPSSSDSAHVPRLPHRIELRTRRRHRIRLETFALQRAGVLSDEVGVGLGATYENANFGGRGEAFRTRIAGSVASDFDPEREAPFSSAQLEGSASLTYPYLIGPFGRLEQAFRLYDARSQFSLSLLTARRENLGFIIRGRGQARLRLEMGHTPTLSSLVDIFDISLSNPDTLGGFQAFLDRIIGSEENPVVTDPVQRARIRNDYTKPQVNSNLRYTLRSSTVNPLQRERGHSYEASLEVGNTLPALLDRLVFTPDTVESSLPGLPSLGGEGSTRLLYRPYVRFVGDARRYWVLGRGTVLAGKAVVGWAHPIGRPDVVPFDRRFYSGGASSVRGWGLRELRPAPTDTLGSDVPNLLGGDIKLEASLELRQTLLEDVLSTDWIVALFADAGNAWIGPRNPGPAETRFRFDRFYRQLGVGTGLGLRLSWDYLTLRLDMAYRLVDPLSEHDLVSNGLHQPHLHFGIGHAF